MEESSVIRLDLRAPLVYVARPGLAPFKYGETAGSPAGHKEELFCFELDPARSRSIEPDRERFLGTMIFAGQIPESGSAERNPAAEHEAGTVLLPAGLYLFAQKRKALGREACIDLAIEQHKDGLWERLKPENRLYIRYLFEDGSAVTQIFRPVSGF